MGQVRQRGKVWWIRYYRNGRRHEESSGSTKKQAAIDLLKIREGDVAKGVPISAKVGQLRFEQAAEDLLNDYQSNGRKSYDDVKRRIDLALEPWFRRRRLATVSTLDVRAYVAHRQKQEAANATINRELAALKRMYSLAIQDGSLLHRPYIPMLQEHNVRQGFFEREQFVAVRGYLVPQLRGLVTFAYCTGWRVNSEVLTLRWPQVDRRVGTVRLEPGTTKNSRGRLIKFHDLEELKGAIEGQWAIHEALRRHGIICPWVFPHTTPVRKRGQRIKTYRRSWLSACKKAGIAGRIPHDFRRTAVRNLERAGVPRTVAMQITGHLTESVYRRYDIVSDADLTAAARQLNAAFVRGAG